MPTYKDLTSPKEKTMKHAPLVALALAALLVAGCGGSGSSITAADLAAVEEERDAALEAQREAEEEAREASEEAEEERRRAEQAEGQIQNEQEARQEAEARADDLEEEAGHTADQLVQANARQVYGGLSDFLDLGGDGSPDRVGTADPTVTPRYRDSALVTTAPPVTFSSITTGRSGNWDRTSLSHRGGTNFDRIDVYSDAEAPIHVPFRDSEYNDGTDANEVPHTSALEVDDLYGGAETAPSAVVDSEGDVVGSLSLSGDTVSNVAVSPFPRSGDPAKSFTITDRGEFDAAERNNPTTQALIDRIAASQLPRTDPGYEPPPTYRNVERYPLRYTYEQSGSLAGASGTFTCAGAAEDTSCSVTNQNNHFLFTGPWFFTPSASARVRVDDAEFMYFGWWARQVNLDGSWDFRIFHGPAGSRMTPATTLTGTATYSGPAVGQFSFYQPLTAQSEYGEFSAMATLTADFGTLTTDGGVVGRIDQFTNHPDWTLTLNRAAINGGTATGGDDAVSWQIDGEATAAPDSGTWEAAFYSNLPPGNEIGQRDGTVPTGMAGTFEAAYHNVGAIIGAFGAQKQP